MKKKKLIIILLAVLIAGAGSFILLRQPSPKPAEKSGSAEKTGKNKILYYRNPMNPEVTSPVPMKDSMGMDYVAVYEGKQREESGIHISPEKQQLIGMKTDKVEKRNLTHEILAVGKVAYDPELYITQEEYLQALKTVNTTKNSALASVTEQSRDLLAAAEKKTSAFGNE